LALFLVAAGSVFPVYHVDPLIRGVADAGNSNLRNAIYKYGDIKPGTNPNLGSAWATIGTASVKDIVTASGVDVLNSVSFYPDSSYFVSIGMEKYKSQWDRYANVNITPSETTNSIIATQGDEINFNANLCSTEFKQTGVRYLASSTPILGFRCLENKKIINASSGMIYLYTIP
jgi:hypothetical protein